MLKLNDPTLLRQKAFVGGAWINARATDDAPIAVINPATGETVGTVPSLGADETQRAIEAA